MLTEDSENLGARGLPWWWVGYCPVEAPSLGSSTDSTTASSGELRPGGCGARGPSCSVHFGWKSPRNERWRRSLLRGSQLASSTLPRNVLFPPELAAELYTFDRFARGALLDLRSQARALASILGFDLGGARADADAGQGTWRARHSELEGRSRSWPCVLDGLDLAATAIFSTANKYAERTAWFDLCSQSRDASCFPRRCWWRQFFKCSVFGAPIEFKTLQSTSSKT